METEQSQLPSIIAEPPSGYRSTALAAAVVRAASLAVVVVSGVCLAALITQFRALDSDLGLIFATSRVSSLAPAVGVVAVVCGLATLLWMRRA